MDAQAPQCEANQDEDAYKVHRQAVQSRLNAAIQDAPGRSRSLGGLYLWWNANASLLLADLVVHSGGLT